MRAVDAIRANEAFADGVTFAQASFVEPAFIKPPFRRLAQAPGMDLVKSIALSARAMAAQSGRVKSAARAIAEREAGKAGAPLEPTEPAGAGPAIPSALRDTMAAAGAEQCRETNLRVVEATRSVLVRAILMLR